PTYSLQSLPLAQQAPQPPAYPAVQTAKDPLATTLEVAEPAAQRSVQVGDDNRQTATVLSFRLSSHTRLELPQALGPHQPLLAVKAVAQEVKRFAARINDTGLARMQAQAVVLDPLLHQSKRLLRFCLAAAEDDELIRVPHHLQPLGRQQVVQGVEVDVA